MRSAYLTWALVVLLQLSGGCFLFASPNATSCSELAKKYRLDPELTDAAMAFWAQGITDNTVKNEEMRPEAKRDLTIDSQKQADKLQAYCDSHPFASFDQAVRNIYFSPKP